MKIQESVQNGVAVLALAGKLMGGPEMGEFGERIAELKKTGIKRVVLDMGEVEWINSTGLGMIISAYTTLTRDGGGVKLARVGDRVQNLFVITKLVTLFDAYESVESAVTSYGK